MRGRVDDRAQAIQIGAVLLFGFLVLAFSAYQAVSIPSQNERIEIQHSEVVTEQMQEFRVDVIEASSTGAPRSQAFSLGTGYPSRVFGVNPPPASGSLRSEQFGSGEYYFDAPGVDLTSICGIGSETGDPDGVRTNALVYQPDYSEYSDSPTIVYENTVTYRQFDDETLIDTDQTIVDGTTITISPLLGDVSTAGTQTRVVDVRPGAAGVGASSTDSDATYNLTIPTALDAAQWEALLSEEPRVEDVSDVSGGVSVTLEAAEYTVVCPVNGLESSPDNSPANRLTRPGDGGASLNPAGSGEVRLDGIADGGTNAVELTFVNAGDEVNLTDVRYNFYSTGAGGSAPGSFDLEESGTVVASNVELRGPAVQPSSTVTFPGDDASKTLTVAFDDTIQNQDYFVIELQFSDGQESLYFVDVSEDTGEGSASQVTLASSQATDGPSSSLSSVMEFTLNNSGPRVTITDISIDGTTSTADTVETSQGSEEEFAEAGGSGSDLYTGVMSIDTTVYTLEVTSSINNGNSKSYELKRFKDSDGEVDLNGEEVTITIYFKDGSTASYTLSG